MLLRSTLVAMFALPTLISGSKPPVVRRHAHDYKNRARAVSRDASTPIPGKLRVVENSGVCETTPGVYQASGYGDISANKSIWFWFFAARNNPQQAPLITWFNGEPGSSSMLGLFQELGPCRINNQSTGVDLNPTSWNEYANVLFIDQPVGVGFSYGIEDIYSSEKAAVDVWEFLQIWFADERFSKYSERQFGIWTESYYGGHFGTHFATYFLQQNDAIRNGTVKGQIINLTALGMGNPAIDYLTLNPSYIKYAESNPYHTLVDPSVISSASTAWSQKDGCRDQIIECNSAEGIDVVCSAAQNWCNKFILEPLTGDWDVYYVPEKDPDPYPPVLEPYLQIPAITSKIGSQVTWFDANALVFYQFLATGDGVRSVRPYLETVINSGVRTVIYDGDADFLCNYVGVEAMIDSLDTKFSAEYARQSFATYKVNGNPAGLYKNAGTFSYLRVFEAGHEVPAYGAPGVPRGAAALQMFTQIMSNQSLSST